ncbi:HlyD family type I secretion periplasmic adaptor subunit [Terasakiella sp. A23]|uniref:HlyD family type I secretion periplasmic adaptor subunit n=1 Tax=Terasakiella sp. FCG-A23 TaxID=3080561 RepID=UPI002952FC4B|nr:HlyD family type I secretion periplasmic adaptor subunit [Terasakiella sp. A23]MDV7338312.1 HlyD family type I secretion periplasmic adaptor subunit [Terasakiella sp. A23]
MSVLKKMISSKKKSPWLYPSRFIILLLCGIGYWSHTTVLDEVAIASGRVVPQGKVKTVQHLEGGIIKELNIVEGQSIRSGDALMTLTLGVGKLNQSELETELDGFKLVKARLVAESQGLSFVKFPDESAKRRPDITEQEKTAFNARKSELSGQLSVIRKQIKQKELAIESLRARRNSASSKLDIIEENQALAEDAMNKGMGTRSEYLELSTEVENLLGDIRTIDADIPAARADIEEARARLNETRLKYKRKASEQLSKVTREISRIEKVLGQANEQEQRTIVRAPIDGTVKNLKYTNVGAVIRPGEPIMELVPMRDSLVVEAQLSPTDRGYVQLGLPAKIKVSAYDFVQYGALPGRVIQIAPDTDKTEDGVPYYRVIIATDRTYLGDGVNVNLPITTGMETQVDIVTGRRSVLEFFLRPLLRLKDEAFRER